MTSRPPVGAPQDEASGLVERLEDAAHLAIGKPRADGLAEAGGRSSQALRIAAKPAPRSHSREPRRHGPAQRVE